ncbi:MAG TPA: AAA family ATPase [Candidatus Ornithocaccomicrobium faecavium]|uniref:Shikimate kinase n=1 Tax=Candidatus Ornithocaccomicrobium faecavium TaxID=2840890 RepID=A0A9D1P767_9FIRM|nr:AAA family ATPase [Candidatus Ornithocaccomicrobium faecavium]
MKYGLIGEKLGHSYSCQVHRALGNPDYVLKEIAPDALGDFLRARDFAGLNVTIPYKQAVIPYVDALTDTAREVGAVNTLYFDASGALWGDNTDVYGFCTMLEGIDVRGKKALVLGSGGTSHTACYALRALGAGDCIVVSRRGAVNYENVYSLHADAEVIVNATPVGMFPNNGARPIDIRRFPRLCAVADVIYNPARTALLQDADALGIPRAGGLSMLVAQAARSVERFSGRALGEEAWRGALRQVAASLRGVALVGMPGCGKSTIAQAVAQELGRACVDLDAEIEREAGKSIPEIFAQDGEEAFRAAETRAARQFSRENAVLATGGGCVLRAENAQALRANSLVVWLKRAIDQLPREGRPLSVGNLYEMEQKRAPYYLAASDVQIENQGSVEEVAAAVVAALREGAVHL